MQRTALRANNWKRFRPARISWSCLPRGRYARTASSRRLAPGISRVTGALRLWRGQCVVSEFDTPYAMKPSALGCVSDAFEKPRSSTHS